MSSLSRSRTRSPLLFAVACALLATAPVRAAAPEPPDVRAAPRHDARALAVADSFATADLQQLGAIFEADYRPADHLATTREQLALLERQAELDGLPVLTLNERLYLNAYGTLSLDLDVGATVPLYRSSLQPRAALLDQRLTMFGQEAAFAEAEARTAFFRDVFSLALLRQLASEAAAALERLAATGWRAPVDTAEALLLPPLERELLALRLEVDQLRSFALEQLQIYQRRIGAALGLELEIVAMPSFDSLVEQFDRLPPRPDACLAASPLVLQAHGRHDEHLLDWRAANSPDFRLDLLGNVSVHGGDLAASVGLEARLPLPGGWPVAGEMGAVARPEAMEQTLRLSWPPPLGRRAFAADVPAEAADDLAHELGTVAAQVTEMLQAEQRALGAIAERELRLLWFTRDQHGATADDLSAVRELAFAPAADPVAELQAVQLRSEVGFARLSHVEALLDLRLMCGAR